MGEKQVCRECRQPLELREGGWAHVSPLPGQRRYYCQDKAGTEELIEPWPGPAGHSLEQRIAVQFHQEGLTEQTATRLAKVAAWVVRQIGG